MESPGSDEMPFFESSEGAGSSIEDVSMDGAQFGNFDGLDYEGYMDLSELPANASSLILPLPNLSSILETERKRKKGSRRIKKSEYDEAIANLQEYGERHGFLDTYLELIWNLISSETSTLNCAQRRSLIFIMLPDQQVGHQFINKILYGLREAKRCKPTVLTAIYQLLNLYFDNRLDDDNEIISTNTINCILTARTENFIIPWKTRLVRSIVTPEILTVANVNALKNLLETNGIKKTQRDDIYATLGLCKHMRPDLFTDHDLPPWKMRVLNFPEDVRKRFYDARVRIQNEGRTHHPLQDRIFPEFLPDCNRFSARKTILNEMLSCLDSDERTAFLAINPVLLHVFEEWLKPILNYRFHHFSGFTSAKDQLRYNFMLSKIAHITKVRQVGLKVMNQWLVDLLCNWDSWIFNDTVISLMAFIRPEDVLRNGEKVKEKLEHFSSSIRQQVIIWKILESWFFGWTEAVPIEKGEGDESSLSIISNVDSRKWLLKLMNHIVEETMLTIDDSDNIEAQNIRIQFSNFIYFLLEDRNQIDFQNEETSVLIDVLKTNLIQLLKVSENIPALGLD